MTEQDRLRLSPSQVGQLASLLGGEGVRTLHLDTVRGRLSIAIAPCGDRLDGVAASEEAETLIVSATTVGEFLTTHPYRPAPMVQPGDVVGPGDLLGFIRIGALVTPVAFAAKRGRSAMLVEVLADDGALVVWGTALFRMVQR